MTSNTKRSGKDIGSAAAARGGRAGRPRSARADAAILDAAMAEMRERGYARMSVDGVAARAGVSKPTVYLRHAGKAQLATAALAAQQQRALPRPTGDTRADLVAHLRQLRRGVERPFGMATLGTVLAEEARTPELLALFRKRIVAPRRRAIRAVLGVALDRGELRPHADLDAAVIALVGSYYAQYLAGPPFPRAWPGTVVDVVLDGLRP
jgi:AcrR family transcriptional regulator